VPRHILELLDEVAHAGQAIQLSLGSAKDQVIRLDLPNVDAQRHPKNVLKRLLRSRRRYLGDEIHGIIPSFDKSQPDQGISQLAVEAIGAGCAMFQVGDRPEALDASYSSALKLGNRLLRDSRYDGVSLPFPDIKAQGNVQEIVDCATHDGCEANQPADRRASRHNRVLLGILAPARF
jgi:hypothetical protein